MESNWKNDLIEFYKNRADFIKEYVREDIDFTDVYDPFINEKKDNPFLIIGEAPGAYEVKLKQPFVGKAGENLTYLIKKSGFDRKKDFLITNAFPFRTYKENKNRTPNTSELRIGAKLLEKEIKIIKPFIILLLGNSAIKAFSYISWAKSVKNLTKCGIYEINNFKIGLCYHPSPLAFNRKNIKEALEKFFERLRNVK